MLLGPKLRIDEPGLAESREKLFTNVKCIPVVDPAPLYLRNWLDWQPDHSLHRAHPVEKRGDQVLHWGGLVNIHGAEWWRRSAVQVKIVRLLLQVY